MQPTEGHGLYFLLPQSLGKLTVLILHSSILQQKKKHLFRKQQEKDYLIPGTGEQQKRNI